MSMSLESQTCPGTRKMYWDRLGDAIVGIYVRSCEFWFVHLYCFYLSHRGICP